MVTQLWRTTAPPVPLVRLEGEQVEVAYQAEPLVEVDRYPQGGWPLRVECERNK